MEKNVPKTRFLNVRVTEEFRERVCIHAIKQRTSIAALVAEALEEKMARDAARKQESPS